RGRKTSLDALVKHMREDYIKDKNETVFISHGDCIDDANYVADCVKKEFGITDIKINYVGGVIGSHSGPGTVALFYIGKKR
ncbi:MAG: DegV family protein, partial [Oscillospiraceae bacterium]